MPIHRHFRRIAAVLALLTWPVLAAAWEPDIWHRYAPGSPFYQKNDSITLHGAGVAQSDGRAALLLLAPDKDGAVVTVNLPGWQAQAELLSVLIMPKGNRYSRTVKENELQYGSGGDGTSVEYSFGLAPQDIELFMAARSWELTTGGQTTTITLKGSRKAITAALEARERGDRHHDTDWIAECDKRVSHAWDGRNTSGYAVAWSDIDPVDAKPICQKALEANPEDARTLYHMGRLLDKAGDKASMVYLRYAGEAKQYPIALNHLGILYRDGTYGPADRKHARSLFTRGADVGNIPSKYNLALALIEDGGGTADRLRARVLLEDLAEANYTLATTYFGKALFEGTFGLRETALGVQYLSIAADEGSTDAAYRLAEIYRDGLSDAGPDPALYLDYLRAAAEGGHRKARAELGLD